MENEVIDIPSLRISELEFKDGTKVSLNDNDIVVFVGANNVGKSRVLKDIKDNLIGNKEKQILVKNIIYKEDNFNEETLNNYIKNKYANNRNTENEYSISCDSTYAKYIDENQLQNVGINPHENFYFTLFSFLTTDNRLNMTSPGNSNNVMNELKSIVMKKLIDDNILIQKLNPILKNYFGRDTEINISENMYSDNTYEKIYKYGKINKNKKSNSSDNLASKRTLKNMPNLYDQGDGIRSAVAILASLIVLDNIVLIDEPETFLHPPQARILGNDIINLSKNKQCFIATHNIDIIRGLLEKKSSRVKIIKIDRDGDTNKIYVMGNKDISSIANNKSLKYTNILNGLFYKHVILCENESDCKFFAAVLESLSEKLYHDVLFCGVGGKTEFKKIIKLLKKVDINCSIIADLDLLDDPTVVKEIVDAFGEKYDILSEHKEFLKLLKEENITKIKKQSKAKEEINKILNNDDKYMSDETIKALREIIKESNGIELLKKGKNILPSGDCNKLYTKIVAFLNKNNIYVIENGTIENYNRDSKLHGDLWVDEILSSHPTIETDEIYDDPKKLIKKIFEEEFKEDE